MRRYRAWERFFKRGEFFGIEERIHLHVLKDEKALVVNLFNISSKPQKVSGSIKLSELGLDPALNYVTAESWAKVAGGVLTVEEEMPAWWAKVTTVSSTPLALSPPLARPTPRQYAWHEQERIMFACMDPCT